MEGVEFTTWDMSDLLVTVKALAGLHALSFSVYSVMIRALIHIPFL